MDVTPIVERFDIISNALDALHELQTLEYHELEEEYFLRSAAEREFQVAIQAALDIGSILVAEEAGDIPETYDDVFPALADIGVLPRDFAEHFNRMAEFRDNLVYMDVDIDTEQLYNYLQDDLVDFDLYMQYVGTYLTEQYGE